MNAHRETGNQPEAESCTAARDGRLGALALRAVVAGHVLLSGGVLAGDGVRVVPVGETFAGTTYEDLVVPWWDWATNTGPVGCNAIQDTTGEYAKIDQGEHNPQIFWLAGSFGSKAHRVVEEVPEGVFFFFPLVNTLFWAPEDGDTIPELKEGAAEFPNQFLADPESTLRLTVDGMVLGTKEDFASDFRVCGSGMHRFIDGNMSGDPVDSFEDRIAVADGLWAALEPLPAGYHSIRIEASTGEASGLVFALDVTYDLWVGGPRPRLLPMESISRSGDDSFELRWSGGKGSVEGTVDGWTWEVIAANVESPATVAVNLGVKPSQIFRVVEP